MQNNPDRYIYDSDAIRDLYNDLEEMIEKRQQPDIAYFSSIEVGNAKCVIPFLDSQLKRLRTETGGPRSSDPVVDLDTIDQIPLHIGVHLSRIVQSIIDAKEEVRTMRSLGATQPAPVEAVAAEDLPESIQALFRALIADHRDVTWNDVRHLDAIVVSKAIPGVYRQLAKVRRVVQIDLEQFEFPQPPIRCFGHLSAHDQLRLNLADMLQKIVVANVYLGQLEREKQEQEKEKERQDVGNEGAAELEKRMHNLELPRRVSSDC